MTEIPTEPCSDPADTIMAALAHGLNGNPTTGLGMLQPFIVGGPRTTVSMCAALAGCIALVMQKQAPCPDGFGFLAIRGGVPTDPSDMPIGPRFAAQFTTAWLNDQRQTAHALFDALRGTGREDDAENVFLGVTALYDMAISSLRELTGGTR